MALSRFDPWGTSSTWRDPFDDFFTSVTPFAGAWPAGGALTERARQPLLPTMHMDVKGACTYRTCGLCMIVK